MNNQYPGQPETPTNPSNEGPDSAVPGEESLPPDQQASNPAPPSQPETTPPQQEVEQQSSTGLESQPILSEEYTPEPDYQKARVPKSRPFLKMFFIITAIIIIIGGVVFFLLFFNKGTLKLTVNPPEALVKIDDQEYPTKITYEQKLPAGEHILNITLSGYIEYNKKIEIGSFKTTELTIDLNKIPEAKKILEGKMEFISLSPDKKYLVGLGDSGKTFYRIPITNNNAPTEETPESQNQPVTTINAAQAITENNFANIIDVIWNPAEELAILKIKNEEEALKNTDFWRQDSENGTITTWLYDFNRYDLANQESTFLGDDIGDIVWSPDGKKIIYYSKTKKSLNKANGDNSSLAVIKNIQNISKPTLDISPDGKFLALVPQSFNYQKNYLYKIDLYSKDLKQLIKEGNQKEAIFNPGSNKILYATYSQDPNSSVYTSLSIIDVDGKNNKNLDLRILIDKVAFLDDNNFLYAFLEDQSQSEVLKKFNLESNEEKDYFFTSEEKLRFENMVLAENKEKVYFLSENYLYQLDLVTDEY